MYHSYLDAWKEDQRAQIEGHVYNFIDQFIERYTGTLLPPDYTLTEPGQILDIACGFGAWVRSLARTYPGCTVTGCDKDAKYITYAHEHAKLARLTNAHFIVANMYTLPEPAAAYDLIHARLLSPAVLPGTWFYLLKDLWQHCKPGGQLIWTETRIPATGGSAITRWCHLFGQALAILSSTGDVVAHMPTMLNDVGFEHIQSSTTTVHLQYGTAPHNTLTSMLWRTSPLLQTFFVQSGVTSASHFTHITDEMLIELVDHNFSCDWSLHTVIARRPNT